MRSRKHQNFNKSRKSTKPHDTSWQGVSKWYNEKVGEKGSYFHEHVVIPNTLKMLDLNNNSRLLDLGCGQGVLLRNIGNIKKYTGIDLSKDLIEFAKKNKELGIRNYEFIHGDITKSLEIEDKDFTHAAIILALQNVEDFQSVFKNASNHLVEGGKFLIVINHPHFRIPKQTSWGIDERRRIQYRRVDHYSTPLKIAINMTPGSSDKNSVKNTWSFHNSLQDYTIALKENGFVIEEIQEWISDKKSQGPAAQMEDRARNEIPMFMGILARKVD